MTASAGPALTCLYAEFGNQVAFVTLYVRKAHPGDRSCEASLLTDFAIRLYKGLLLIGLAGCGAAAVWDATWDATKGAVCSCAWHGSHDPQAARPHSARR
jgi:hypothetical protein